MTTATPLAVSLDRTAAQPLSLQLARQVRALVAAGTLGRGQRLPSSRALARDLGVARAVVETAFDQLLAEGWVVTRRGAGTFVHDVGLAAATNAAAGAGSAGVPTARGPAEGDPVVRFDTGSPWVEPRLQAGWRRAWRDVSVASIPRGYPDPAGIPELREEVASYVSRHRGVPCSAQQVLITGGTTHGLALVLDVLGPAAVAIEDPGYQAAVQVARDGGHEVVDVPVDGEGIDVRHLAALRRTDIGAVYVTPAHQHPLGITMSAARRVAVLAEARRRRAWVIEDDYDSEFRYDVAPLPALAGLSGDVVYLGTAAKTVHPGLRLGWLVATPGLVAELARRRARRHDHPSWPLQRAMLGMLRDGHVDRLVRTARRVYAQRGELVRRRLQPYADVTGGGAGMYVTVSLPKPVAQRAVAEARSVGLVVPSLADYCRSARRHGIVLGFGGVSDTELDRCLAVLARSLAGSAGEMA